ncbi:MAG TPA: right-handed parallel beta-helix repeat-containing protein [Candidatus Saccharimonadales bacterium]
MKTKIIVVISIIIVALIGFWVWFFLSLRTTPPSTDQPQTNQQTDSIQPKVKLTIPESSLSLASTSKVLEVSVEAEDNVMVVRVEYLLDGKVVARSIEPPYRVTINLANLDSGEHTLQAVAYDAAGNRGESDIFVFVIVADEVIPQGEASEGVVERSASFASTSGTQANSSSSSGNSSGGNSGGMPGPTPTPERTAGGWWAYLPQRLQVCSNNGWNDGPTSMPAEVITVPAGSNAGFNFNQSGKTFWFAPGVHTLGNDQFGQIIAGANSTYIGAPGAIIDGQNINKYAFTGFAENVRVAYLEIRNFGSGNDNNNEGVINHDAADGWTMEYLNAHHNDGAAVFLGSENTVSNNCLKDNGQYGFSMFKMPIDGDSAIKDIVIDNNEIVGNNQDNWEAQIVGCGCTGGGKFWDVEGAIVTNNYVHDNLSTGLWADTNDIDFLFDSNWIEHNSGEGIWYEISYNATISRNVIKRNAWTSGVSNQGSPGAAIYISESGGDSRLQSTTSGSSDLRINNNLLDDNFSGISIYENSNRFCNSNGNTSKGYCTPFVSPTLIPEPHNFTYPNPISSTHPCYTNIGSQPYTNDCRWHSNNVQVYNNEFHFDEAVVPCAGNFCGAQALYATGSNNIPWAPAAYNVGNVQNDVMFNNNNKFFNNKYFGNWRFAKGFGETVFFSTWQATPFSQDNGSTFDGAATPPPDPNALDDDTATLEGAIGEWVAWFNDAITRSTAEAHTGTHSLQVSVTGSGSWGVQLDNHPGFSTAAGNKRISFWAKRGTGAISSMTMRVKWFDFNDQLVQTNDVPISTLTTSWQQGTLDATAPAGTASVFVELVSSSGGAGNTVYADDFVIADIP